MKKVLLIVILAIFGINMPMLGMENNENWNDNDYIDEISLEEAVIENTEANTLGEKLVFACEDNNLELAKQLIKEGANVNFIANMAKRSNKRMFAMHKNALTFAISQQNIELLQLLLDAKVQIREKDLQKACDLNNETIIIMLIKGGAQVSADHLERAIKAKNEVLMRLLQKMNVPVTSVVLEAIWQASEELQSAFFEGSINVTQNEINTFINQNNRNRPNDYLMLKYVNFDEEIIYLKEGKVDHNEKLMKKHILKNVHKNGDAFEIFLYKLVCATGITPTVSIDRLSNIQFIDKFPVFNNNQIKRFFIRFQEGKLNTAAFITWKKEKSYPINTLLSAAALGKDNIISRIGDVFEMPAIINERLGNEFAENILGIYPRGANPYRNDFKYSGAEKLKSFFDKAFQVAIMHNQIDVAKMLIAYCDVTKNDIFTEVKSTIDSLSKMKHESKIFYSNRIFDNQYNDNIVTNLKIERDKEALRFDEMQFELKRYLYALRSFIVTCVKSTKLPAEVIMTIVRYSPEMVNGRLKDYTLFLKNKESKKMNSQKKITDYFKPVKKN